MTGALFLTADIPVRIVSEPRQTHDWVDYATLGAAILAAIGTVAAVWWAILATRRVARKNLKIRAFPAGDGVGLLITNEGPRSINVHNVWLEERDGEMLVGTFSYHRSEWPARLEEGETLKILIPCHLNDDHDLRRLTAHVTDAPGDHWKAKVEKPKDTHWTYAFVPEPPHPQRDENP
jgi:hypothetical protein